MILFKRVLSLALCFVTLGLCGCTSAPAPQTEATSTAATEETIDRSAPLCDGKTLKMLVITSSFGLNTTQFLYDVAKAEGCTDVVIGRLYGSGCTLEMHWSNAQTNANYYQYTKNTTGEWAMMEGIPLIYGLQDEDWDIIFLQQSAGQAGIENSYSNYIDKLMPYLHENKTNPKARFIWNVTWAYQGDSDQKPFTTVFQSNQMAMYEEIMRIAQTLIVPRTDFDRICPTGTVIQNARTSEFGDNLCKDTYHLNNYGGILAAYGMFSALTDKEITAVNLDAVSSSQKSGIGGAQPILEPLTETQKAIIMESVNNAMKNPFEVTPSAYK